MRPTNDPREMARERRRRDWNYCQIAVIGGVVLSIFLPMAWALEQPTATGGIGSIAWARMSLIGLGTVIVGGEIVRRLNNWESGEPICKWFWQK